MTDVFSVAVPDVPVLDVVFLHGLGGDARKTWASWDAFWPSWLSEDVRGVAVWSVGYAASPSGWLGRAMPIQDRAVNVLARLQNEGVGDRPLVFVTHSMGGLLAKQMLMHAQSVSAYASFAAAARGVVFLATPHTGADMATFLKRLKRVLRTTAAGKDLARNGAHLRDLNVRYREWVQKTGIQNLVFFEAYKTWGVQIVDAGSADPGLAGAGPIAIDADHFAICKPASRTDVMYGQVRRFVAGIRDTLPTSDPGSGLSLPVSSTAQGPATTEDRTDSGLGRRIEDCDPFDLEVHSAPPAVPGDTTSSTKLPSYVRRPHDDDLATRVVAAAGGDSQMVVLVGSSSTGKTRACWEAIQPLADDGWRLWHPFDPNRAEAVLASVERVGPKTILWLNDAQHYFNAGNGLGERVAAVLSTLLTDPQRGPVLILATLWGEHVDQYMNAIHTLNDSFAQVRALIVERRIYVPDSFDEAALAKAQDLAEAGDEQLAASLLRTGDGRVAQDLAGGPELLHRYHIAQPAVRAVLQAAMDARRLGIRLRLPLGFLQQAAEGYLTDFEYDALDEDWFQQAIADLARPVYGDLAPLRRIRSRRSTSAPVDLHSTSTPSFNHPGPTYRLADYLEQYGHYERRQACPPSSFWRAGHDHITDPDELTELATAALRRYRLSWAFYLQGRSGVCPPSGEGVQAYAMRMRETGGDREGVDVLVRKEAEAGSVWALMWLAARCEDQGDLKGAENLLREAAKAGHIGAIARLVTLREAAGDIIESNLFRDQLVATVNCSTDLLPRMHLRKGHAKTFERSASLAPHVSYIWVQSHGPTGWVFSAEGSPIPVECCATIDGIPLIVAFHSGNPDASQVVESILQGNKAERLNVFISRRSISDYKAESYRQLEGLAQRSVSPREAEAAARKCADAGAFWESFFSDELDSNTSPESNSWIIDHVTKWWPYGLDPDGKPSTRW